MDSSPEQKAAQARAQEILDKLPEEARAKLVMDNDGNLVAKNRAYRRQKPPTPTYFTKASKKKRQKRKKTNGTKK